MTTYADTRGAGLQRAFEHWRERGALLDIEAAKPAQPGITIAISRERGAGGTDIAHRVAEQLNWPVYDQELVGRIAADAATEAQLIEKLDEKRPSWLAECLDALTEEKSMTGAAFAIRLRKILLALYCHGNCIILGRGAAHVLPEKRTLRIRLVAPETHRVQKATDHLGIAEKAAHHVADIDRARVDFVKSYFQKDPTDPHEYDLTLDSSRFSEEQCRDFILMALNARQTRL
jgi:cytidylate kinase